MCFTEKSTSPVVALNDVIVSTALSVEELIVCPVVSAVVAGTANVEAADLFGSFQPTVTVCVFATMLSVKLPVTVA